MVPRPNVNPYWKFAVVEVPFGFTVPCSVALVGRIAVTPPVTTVGGGGHVAVVNAASDPAVVPPELSVARTVSVDSVP